MVGPPDVTPDGAACEAGADELGAACEASADELGAACEASADELGAACEASADELGAACEASADELGAACEAGADAAEPCDACAVALAAGFGDGVLPPPVEHAPTSSASSDAPRASVRTLRMGTSSFEP